MTIGYASCTARSPDGCHPQCQDELYIQCGAGAALCLLTCSVAIANYSSFSKLQPPCHVLVCLQEADHLVEHLQTLLRVRGGDQAAAYDFLDQVASGNNGYPHDVANAERAVLQTELLYAILQQREAEEAAQAQLSKEPRDGTLGWYLKHKDDPIAPGSKCTVFQAAYCLLRLKMRGQMTDKSLAALIYFLTGGGALPEKNVMPGCVDRRSAAPGCRGRRTVGFKLRMLLHYVMARQTLGLCTSIHTACSALQVSRVA
jgi:hypothetical protein